MGKIIGVVGPPGSGKSFLARKLAKYYHAALFSEKTSDYPRRIQQNLLNRQRMFETYIWFRNYHFRRHLIATSLRKRDKWVILDTFWLTARFFIPAYSMDPFERRVAMQLAQHDRDTLPWPDVIAYINSPLEGRNRAGRISETRKWEQQEHFRTMVSKVKAEHRKFFQAEHLANLIWINRKKNDFQLSADFERLVGQIHCMVENGNS